MTSFFSCAPGRNGLILPSLRSPWPEVIVVHNYSTDGTRKLLRSLDLPDVEVALHPRNLGTSASMLSSIERARRD